MKILKYQIMTEVNLGTKEHPNIVQVFDDKDMRCSDANFETSYAMAVKESYNGEVTVEDILDEPTQLDRIESQATYTAMMTDTLLESEA